jgi:hypothetical protein
LVLALLDRDVAASVTTPDASLELARARGVPREPPSTFGKIHARRLLTVPDGEPVRAEGPPSAAAQLRELVAEDDDEASLGDLLSSPVSGGGAVGRLFQRLLSPTRGRGRGGPPGADSPTHVTTARPGAGRRAVISTATVGSLDAIETDRVTAALYPEWDVHRGRYRPDWCSVQEIDPTVGADQPEVTLDGAVLRRPLARLGRGLERRRRQRQGDDVDIDAAVEARVDSIAGASHSDADFYIDTLRRRRDLAVLVLLDVSGSAGEPGAGGRPVHEHQRAAAASLITALHDLGDRVAAYGFNSKGRQAVQLVRIKAFDDQLDRSVGRRLASLTPGAYTRLGAAIRHSTTILGDRAGTPRRLLVVLSDGFAYDHGYEGRYGEADARRALLEARRQGVGCLCLTVGTDTEPAALGRVFGTAAHATIPRNEQLPRVIGPLFRAALRSAEIQRRGFQRKERTRGRLELERRIDAGAAVLHPGR